MGQAIIVTGASRGIGAAIAEHLAGAGFVVGCLSRSGNLPERPGADEGTRANWISLTGDVTDPDAIEAAIAEIAANHEIVGMVNNAGGHSDGASASLAIEEWNQQLELNATSVLIGCQQAYPHLSKSGGLIVNIGSFFEKLGVKRNLAYCASKAAVGAISRVLAVEWAKDGIQVITVAPGYIITDLNAESLSEGPLREYLARRIPGGQPGHADEVGRFVAGLFAFRTPFLSGETVYLDGAQGIAH